MTAFPNTQLRRVFRVTNGGTPTSDPENWDGGIPWATPVDLGHVNGGLLARTGRTLTVNGLKTGSSSVPKGSLIISTRAPIGYVAETTTSLAFNQGCRGLIPTQSMDIRYFRYQLLSMKDTLQSRGLGSTFSELSSESLASTRVHLPRLSVQTSISDYLDFEAARIDSLIEKKKLLVGLLEANYRSYRWERVAGGLRTSVPKVGVPKYFSDSSWRAVRLRYLVERPVGGSWGSEPGEDEIDLTCLRVADFDRWTGTVVADDPTTRSVSKSALDRILLNAGDLLLEKSGGGEKNSVGFVARVPRLGGPSICSNFIARLRPTDGVDGRFVGHVFATLYDQGLTAPFIKQTTGIQNLDVEAFLSQPWAMPLLAEQVAIAVAIEGHLKGVTAVRDRLRHQIQLLVDRRQALITATVTNTLALQGVAA